MNCRTYQSQFSAYLDGDLSPSERKQLHSHLKECLPCYRSWISLQKSVDLLRHLPDLEPPEHLRGMVMARLDGRLFRQRASFFTGAHRWLPLAVGTAALLVFAVVLWQVIPPTLTWESLTPGIIQRLVANKVSTTQPSGRTAVSEHSPDYAGPVMVLKVKDFSRADKELATLLRSFSPSLLPEKQPTRPIRSSSARLIDFQVSGQRYSHLISELHKIGTLDQGQTEKHNAPVARHRKPISIRIIVIKENK